MGFALDLIFPPLCLSCRILCADCSNGLSFSEGAACALCGVSFEADPGAEAICGACHAQPHDFARAWALFGYGETSKALFLSFKYGDRLDQAPAFARWLERTRAAAARRRRPHRARAAASLASVEAALQPGGDIGPGASPARERKRPTRSQGHRPKRAAGITRRFSCAAGKVSAVRDRKVLLVDDVFTTGATLDACARALKRAGAARVDALMLARVVRATSGAI